jgi:hypothetical protein
MYPRLSFVVGLAGAAVAAVAACSADTGETGSGGKGAGHPTGSTVASTSTAAGGAMTTSSGSGAMGPCNQDPNVDGDGDGWTPAEGDCDDCNAKVNPGAVDSLGAGADGGPPMPFDNDCDGKAALPEPCDDGLALDDADPMNAARALDLCQIAEAAPALKADRRWGVLAARWTSASGEARAPGPQAGIMEAFGAAVHPQNGKRLLVLSTGRARLPEQPGACKGPSCHTTSNVDPPDGFPQAVPGCEGGSIISDDVALEVDLRAPTNAVGFSFAFKFHSFEYPAWVCTPYNDQFVALVSPAPAGSINGNVAFDAQKNPVSVNLGWFDVCDPVGMADFAVNCGAPVDTSCPKPPSPYCASGVGALAGTGFDLWGDAGATRWLSTTAPVAGGAAITVRFAIWDTTDQSLDSTVILDDFAWITAGAPVAVATNPVPTPK